MTALFHAARSNPVCGEAEILEEVVGGLRARRKRLPPKLLYDDQGLALLDRINAQPEYDLARMEVCILKAYGVSIGLALGPGVRLVEFGRGSGPKTPVLLEALDSPAAYVPVADSESALNDSARLLEKKFPALRIAPLVADFTSRLSLPAVPAKRSIVFLPSSTIGRFERSDAIALLRKIRREVGSSGGALVGIDLKKNFADMEIAYNDGAGSSARFTINLLASLNRRLGADFDLSAFSHRAHYDLAANRIETHLVSRVDQVVTIAGEKFGFARDEAVLLEYSHKYTLEGFAKLAWQARLRVADTWSDPRRRFAVVYLESVAIARGGIA